MMGFRPSFLRFLFTAELPLAPAINGGSPGGRVDDWAAGVVADVLVVVVLVVVVVGVGVDVSPAASDVAGTTGAVADAGGLAWAGFVPPFIMTARLGGWVGQKKVNRRPESLFGCNRGRWARSAGVSRHLGYVGWLSMRCEAMRLVCAVRAKYALVFRPSLCLSFRRLVVVVLFPLAPSGFVLAWCLRKRCCGRVSRAGSSGHEKYTDQICRSVCKKYVR